jgi:hypothetical protein
MRGASEVFMQGERIQRASKRRWSARVMQRARVAIHAPSRQGRHSARNSWAAVLQFHTPHSIWAKLAGLPEAPAKLILDFLRFCLRVPFYPPHTENLQRGHIFCLNFPTRVQESLVTFEVRPWTISSFLYVIKLF